MGGCARKMARANRSRVLVVSVKVDGVGGILCMIIAAAFAQHHCRAADLAKISAAAGACASPQNERTAAHRTHQQT
jgi:hypothetical protein